ncbi:MAG: hypothetical protein R3E39_18325 [Anaerolineae bacterium]
MKRHSKIERLMNRLDEHELEELRTRLMIEQDGEAVSLDELLAERERQIR